MLNYCLKCKKGTESVSSEMLKTKMLEQCYHQNVLCVIVKNQDLCKNKKKKG